MWYAFQEKCIKQKGERAASLWELWISSLGIFDIVQNVSLVNVFELRAGKSGFRGGRGSCRILDLDRASELVGSCERWMHALTQNGLYRTSVACLL